MMDKELLPWEKCLIRECKNQVHFFGTTFVFDAKQLFHISITKLTFVNYYGNLDIQVLS